MKFCQSVLSSAKEMLLSSSLEHRHTIVIGENSSGKSEVFRKYIRELLVARTSVYYIDSVNRCFDISKVSTPYSDIEKSNLKSIVETRLHDDYFNLKDTFSLFRSLNDQIELIYLTYERRLQEMLKNFLGMSFEMIDIKEKKVRFDVESTGVLSSGVQAVVRIFLELLYLSDISSDDVIVVIDEIDEFLSPANSGKIMNFLIEQFPAMKFLVSTHSIDLVRNTNNCNIIILYSDDVEVIDANDFDDECDVAALFEKVFPIVAEKKGTVEDKLRILLNNRISGVWTNDNENTLEQLRKEALTNSQKLLLQQVEGW